jgi:hypothetical protein
MPVAMKFDEETLCSDAKFSLRKQEDGSFAPSVHLIRKEPELESATSRHFNATSPCFP